MTYILGISALYHDAAAVLLRDGDIVAAAQEERFSRIKHDPGFPSLAIDYCLNEAGIDISQVDHAVFYEKPLRKFDRLMQTYLAYAPMGFSSFRRALAQYAHSKIKLPEFIQHALGPTFRGQLSFTEHHESHAASAFYPSPFEEAAILTLDAVGEWASSSLGIGKGNEIELIHEMHFPHSLGMLYSAFTFYTGFRVNSGEYKLMGLAPYGEPKYLDRILENIVHLNADGSLALDMTYFDFCHGRTMTSDKFHKLFGAPPRSPDSDITQQDMDIAASIQKICEEAVLRAGRFVHSETGLSNLVMAGGVALNCVANGRLLREGPFDEIWIQPAAGDAGGALGAAFLIWHRQLGNPRKPTLPDSQKGSLLGPRFTNKDISVFLDSVGAQYEFIGDESKLLNTVSTLMDQGSVIGWFQGRAEFGPRALGCRSIIGDARSPAMQQKMNLKIKFRESFRPFAPCVLQEYAHEVFDLEPNQSSPYMLFVAPVRDSWRVSLSDNDSRRMEDADLRVRVSVSRSKIPAVTHVDYSARLQTVDSERHGRFYDLMHTFYARTNCPVIVNTSFNIRGEPIVSSPEEAYRCFLATDMDCLVLENCVLIKDQQSSGALQNADIYKAQYVLD